MPAGIWKQFETLVSNRAAFDLKGVTSLLNREKDLVFFLLDIFRDGLVIERTLLPLALFFFLLRDLRVKPADPEEII